MCTDVDIGFGLIERWKASAQDVGTGTRWSPFRRAVAPPGRVTVHRVWQHRHLGEDAFYVVHNLYVDPRRRVRVVKSPTGGPTLSIQRNAFRVACRRGPGWRSAPAPLTLRSIKSALRFGQLPAAPASDVTTLFVSRDGAQNIFHAMADVLNAFLMRHLFPYEQIVFLDTHEDGPLGPLWSLLSPRPIRRFAELDGRCVLRAAAFAPPGGCCFLWKNHHGAPAECRREAPLLHAFRRFMLGGLGLAATPRTHRTVTLTRRYLRADGQLATRRIANEAELVAALGAIDGVQVQSLDFATLSYVEQIRTVLETDVLIGMAGAGMTNMIWLEPDAAVVELFFQAEPAAQVFAGLASWAGLRYRDWCKSEVSPEAARLGYDVPEVVVDVAAIVGLVRDLVKRGG